MNPKELDRKYNEKKGEFYKYIDNIKKTMKVDIYSIINTTIIKNPYNTNFPKLFFLKTYKKENKIFLFIKSSIKFYFINFLYLMVYLLHFILFKIFYKKKINYSKKYIAIDTFIHVGNVVNNNKYEERYFPYLYNIFDKKNKTFLIISRIVDINIKNPFSIIDFFKIICKDNKDFLFEYELLSIKDIFSIIFMIILYPFKTIRLLQKENSIEDKIFNNELIKDIKNQKLDAFTRNIYGQNIAKTNIINKIYSWNEFQVIERSFNYGVKTHSDNIRLYGCQFYLNCETYYSTYIEDIDFIQKSAYDEVLVNGKYYIRTKELVKHKIGVSLRYKNIFQYTKQGLIKEDVILILGSFLIEDTRKILSNMAKKNKKIIFKKHPDTKKEDFDDILNNYENIIDDNSNIYKLFKMVNIVITTASGTAGEAVSCGLSVLIVASSDNFTANPLIGYGKGKIWDIVFDEDKVLNEYDKLDNYRKNNMIELAKISSWYKDNFFIEATEENIIKVFEL